MARGFVRGRVCNLRNSETVGDYGMVMVLDFDLFIDDGLPTVPVRMTGTDFFGRVMTDHVLDVPDPDPSVRPITPWRVTVSHDANQEIIAHYPGLEIGMKSRGLLSTVATVVAPFVVILLVLLWLSWHFGWIG